MTLSEIRESGLLELYVLGHLQGDDLSIVQKAIAQFSELEDDLIEIENALIAYTNKNNSAPPIETESIILATIDYTERLKSGEVPTSPPVLHEKSTLEDFKEWTDRPDMVAPADFGPMYVKFIAHEPEKLTAIVWLRDGAPDETHTDEYEKFLIVEGTCNIIIGEAVHQLSEGSYLTIPLHINHRVEVTSSIPCKIILQRVAA